MKVIDLNIHKLRSFVRVAELKSFRRAGESLHISSPALSTHIRELEETFGVPLLHRTTRNVSLTVEGRRVFSRSVELINGNDAMVEEMLNVSNLQRGRVTIACVPTLAATILPKAISALTRCYPAIELRVFDVGTRHIERLIEDGEADFGIVPLQKGRGFEATPLAEDPFVAVVPESHPFAQRKKVSFAELAGQPIIALKQSGSLRSAVDRAARKAGIVLKVAFEVEHQHAVIGMVQAGLGITVLPSMALPTTNLPGLVLLSIVPRLTRIVGIIRIKGAALSPSAKQFLVVLTSIVDDLKSPTGEKKLVHSVDV